MKTIDKRVDMTNQAPEMVRMTAAEMATTPVEALCRGCGATGTLLFGDRGRPEWCRCSGKTIGPYVAPPGYCVRIDFSTAEMAARRPKDRDP